jgi:hypothetical protein
MVQVRTKPVEGVPVRSTVSQYPFFLKDGPPDSTMLYVREVCDTMLCTKQVVRRYVGFHPL